MALFIETEDNTLVNLEGFRTIAFRTYAMADAAKTERYSIAVRSFDGVFNELRIKEDPKRIIEKMRDKGMII